MGKLPPAVRFLIAFLLLVMLVAGGTYGYSRLEGWPLSDSLYMTFITITTVGFNEVRPLSLHGRQFTMLLLVASVLTVGYSVTVLIGFIFEGQMLQTLKERRMKRTLRMLRNHYIICGGGNTGAEVAHEFKRARVRFLVVEKDAQRSDLTKDPSVLVLAGDAVEDEVLQEAGIERARGLVSALPEDEANVLVVLTARQLNPGLTIVAQASTQPAIRKLLKAGADKVISPKQITGRRLALLLLRPALVNFLDVMVGGEGINMRIEEVGIQGGSPLANKTLREAGIGQHTGAIIVGIMDPDGRVRINPSGVSTLSSMILSEGDVLIALGSDEQLARLSEFVAKGR